MLIWESLLISFISTDQTSVTAWWKGKNLSLAKMTLSDVKKTQYFRARRYKHELNTPGKILYRHPLPSTSPIVKSGEETSLLLFIGTSVLYMSRRELMHLVPMYALHSE